MEGQRRLAKEGLAGAEGKRAAGNASAASSGSPLVRGYRSELLRQFYTILKKVAGLAVFQLLFEEVAAKGGDHLPHENTVRRGLRSTSA